MSPGHYGLTKSVWSSFLPCLLTFILPLFSIQRPYWVPIVTSCQSLLLRCSWLLCSFFFFFFFSFNVSCVTVLCMMKESSTCKEQFCALKASTQLPSLYPTITHWPCHHRNHQAETCSHLVYKMGRTYLYVGRKGDWLTPSLEAPSSSQIYDSLRNSATGKLCGSFWIHLGKDDIHREVCDFFFLNFKLNLKWFLSFPPLVSPRMEETRALVPSETGFTTTNITLSSKSHTHGSWGFQGLLKAYLI